MNWNSFIVGYATSFLMIHVALVFDIPMSSDPFLLFLMIFVVTLIWINHGEKSTDAV
jgi:hypothetical protein